MATKELHGSNADNEETEFVTDFQLSVQRETSAKEIRRQSFGKAAVMEVLEKVLTIMTESLEVKDKTIPSALFYIIAHRKEI